ncbi:hypothetical protein D4R87_00815 [bacterium]|nr:MAG: hypothetical protein D4R87_00815 [bacterium]
MSSTSISEFERIFHINIIAYNKQIELIEKEKERITRELALDYLKEKLFLKAFEVLEHISKFANFRDIREFVEKNLNPEDQILFSKEIHRLAFKIQANAKKGQNVEEYINSLKNLFFEEYE